MLSCRGRSQLPVYELTNSICSTCLRKLEAKIVFEGELARDTPRVWGELTGYQLLAGLVGLLGVIRLIQRDRARD